jgi:hypothetical protein
MAGVMHPIAWATIRLLTGRTIAQVDLDKGLRTARSPQLLAIGAGLATLGLLGATLAWRNWAAVLAATNNSVAAAASGVAGPAMLALIGLALVYASRAQRATASATS